MWIMTFLKERINTTLSQHTSFIRALHRLNALSYQNTDRNAGHGYRTLNKRLFLQSSQHF